MLFRSITYTCGLFKSICFQSKYNTNSNYSNTQTKYHLYRRLISINSRTSTTYCEWLSPSYTCSKNSVILCSRKTLHHLLMSTISGYLERSSEAAVPHGFLRLSYILVFAKNRKNKTLEKLTFLTQTCLNISAFNNIRDDAFSFF